MQYLCQQFFSQSIFMCNLSRNQFIVVCIVFSLIICGTLRISVVNYHDILKHQQRIRFVCISDSHGRHENIILPPGDVLVHAGDFTRFAADKSAYQEFIDWFTTSQNYQYRILISGNNNMPMDLQNQYLFPQYRQNRTLSDSTVIRNLIINNDKIIYLEDSEVILYGLKFYGMPWVGRAEWHLPGDNAFALKKESNALSKKINAIPPDVDILITHGPPFGILDHNFNSDSDGSKLLANIYSYHYNDNNNKNINNNSNNNNSYVIQPMVHIFGHIHEAYGVQMITARNHQYKTFFINAASLSQPTMHKPIVFDAILNENQTISDLILIDHS